MNYNYKHVFRTHLQVLRGMKWVLCMGLGSRSGLNHYRHESNLNDATYFTTLQIHSFFCKTLGHWE